MTYTAAEIAASIGVSERTVQRWRAQGMPSSQSGFDPAIVAGWLRLNSAFVRSTARGAVCNFLKKYPPAESSIDKIEKMAEALVCNAMVSHGERAVATCICNIIAASRRGMLI